MLILRSLRRKELRPIQPEIIKRRLICDLFERSSLPTSTQQQGLARSRYGGVIKILNSKCTFDIDEAIKGILQSAVATGNNVHTRAVRLRLIYSLKTLAHFRPKVLVDFLRSFTQINELTGAIIARHISRRFEEYI